MKWFNNLNKTLRLIITIASWIPLLILLIVIGSAFAGKEVPSALYVLVTVFAAGGIFFLILWIRARKSNVAATVPEKEKQDAITNERNQIIKEKKQVRDTEAIRQEAEAKYLLNNCKPWQTVKLIRNQNEELQENLLYTNVGDNVYIEMDFDKELYLCSAGCDIGYLPAKFNENFAPENFFALVSEIETTDSGNITVKIALFSSDELTVSMPIHSAIAGVTHENRQNLIAKTKEGDALEIKHEPSEKYPEAAAIYNKRTGDKLGYVRSDLARKLLNIYGNNDFKGLVTEITGGTVDKPTLGCNYKIDSIL